MKKLTVFAVAVLLLCLAAIGLAEAATETVVFSTERGKSIKVNKDAEAVDLGGVILSRQGNDFNNLVAFINQLPNLKKLDMYNTEVYASQVESLHAACPQVEFGWTMIIPCTNPLHPERTPHRVRTDQTAFSTLHNNQCALHSTWDLQILRFCRNLKALDIGHNAVDNLNFLYEMPQLKVLILGKNNITDITPLGSLKELEYLELFSNKVTDVTPLAGCESLVDLNIANNSIGDFSPLTQQWSRFRFHCEFAARRSARMPYRQRHRRRAWRVARASSLQHPARNVLGKRKRSCSDPQIRSF